MPFHHSPFVKQRFKSLNDVNVQSAVSPAAQRIRTGINNLRRRKREIEAARAAGLDPPPISRQHQREFQKSIKDFGRQPKVGF